MFNPTENDERAYLEHIIEKLEETYTAVDERVEQASEDLKAQKEYLYENKTGMDAAEKASVKQTVNLQAISGEAAVAFKKRLLKLMETPYFGRIDFVEDGSPTAEPIYVGIHSFHDERENQNLIHDWRAPVAGMFYDFEPGKAAFDAPSGRKEGEIERKRQYRIKDGGMEMMLESDMYIRDDVLQAELSRSADDKMKNIVATIQRDQNAIIRNETAPALIIQGVAGSGKTSIALHRIAFLLYRYKNQLESRDIMIISPNKVFSDYISNVLPELGEESIPEMEMDELAEYVLNQKFRFEGFFEQVNKLLENHDSDFIERVKFKASGEFLARITAYTNWLKRERFTPHELKIRYKTISASYLRQRYNALSYLPLMRRHSAISADVIKKIKQEFGYDLKVEEKKDIRAAVKKMIGSTALRQLYKEFYDWLERPDMFRYAKGSTYEYADVFPLIYLKMQLEGLGEERERFRKVKHLIVDEMQDYTPVQYAVLSKLFSCNKTILGDANQNVNPYSSTSSSDIAEVLRESEAVKLTRSYRSTAEITRFSLRISPKAEVEPVARYGQEPALLEFDKKAGEHGFILKAIREFGQSSRTTLGILCKTQKQARQLHKWIEKQREKYDDVPPVHLLAPGSESLSAGVLISSAHLAKGLEFDEVIVPYADAGNYQTEVDRSMLYIACTRAMHLLRLSYCGQPSSLIAPTDATSDALKSA